MADTFSEIPLFVDTPNYTMRVTLSGREYQLRLDYNGRMDRWYLHLYTATGVLVRGGMKVVCNWPVLRRCSHDDRPPGTLIFLDLSDLYADPPGFSELGRRVRLVYRETVPETPARVTEAVIPI